MSRGLDRCPEVRAHDGLPAVGEQAIERGYLRLMVTLLTLTCS